MVTCLSRQPVRDTPTRYVTIAVHLGRGPDSRLPSSLIPDAVQGLHEVPNPPRDVAVRRTYQAQESNRYGNNGLKTVNEGPELAVSCPSFR